MEDNICLDTKKIPHIISKQKRMAALLIKLDKPSLSYFLYVLVRLSWLQQLNLLCGFCKEVLWMNEEKEVYFNQYCKTCKYCELKEVKDPCNDCLTEPSNINSHKPVNYKNKND